MEKQAELIDLLESLLKKKADLELAHELNRPEKSCTEMGGPFSEGWKKFEAEAGRQRREIAYLDAEIEATRLRLKREGL